MRKHKRMKVLTMEGVLQLWRVTLKDGRAAELLAKNRKHAAEQAGAVWGIPADWLRSNARIVRL